MKVFKHSKVAELKLTPHTGDISDEGFFINEEVEQIVRAYIDDYMELPTYRLILDCRGYSSKFWVECVIDRPVFNCVFTFSLEFMPGNTRMAVSHRTWIDERHRGKGYSDVLQKMKEHLAKHFAVKVLLATINESNIIERKVLRKAGWWDIGRIYDNGHEGECHLYMKDIR